MKRVIIVIGTRPEAIKLIPVYIQLKKLSGINVSLISTGQHREMVQQIFNFFEIKPEGELNLMKQNQSLSQITALLFTKIDEVIIADKPELIIVQGDTTSAMVASMVAFYHQIPVAHVEAGLRSFDKYAPFPEEINRKIISQVAEINFAPTKQAYENLKNESLLKVDVVGNTAIDALELARKKVAEKLSHYVLKFSASINLDKKLILITAHRRESFGNPFHQIVLALRSLSLKYPMLEFVFPAHLNPNVQQPVKQILYDLPNMHVMPPLSYDEMVFLMSRAHIIITDSGGIQEEAPSFGVPVIVLRDVTERPEGIEMGCAVLGGTKKENIETTFDRIYGNEQTHSKMRAVVNPYGDGQAGFRIANIVAKFLNAE